MTLALDNNDIYDVLVDHCNHKPKAPSIDQFQYLATHHGQWPEQVMDSDKDVIVPDLEDERAENALDEHSQSDSSEPTRK